MSSYSLRGLNWFNALSGDARPVEGLPASLKVADGFVGEQPARFIAVVAEKEWDAVRASRELKVTWSASTRPFPEYAKLFEHTKVVC